MRARSAAMPAPVIARDDRSFWEAMLYTIFTMADAATATPLTRRSAGDRIAAWIRGRIVTGQLRRGDRVTQEDVARDLGVSRIPVREALVALDREGWVTIEPHRGAFVAGVDEDWVRDHYDSEAVEASFRSSFWANQLVDSILRRE